MKDNHMKYSHLKYSHNVGGTLENKYENLKKLWWFIMKDNIKLRRKLTFMKAKLSVLKHLSEAEAFRVK